MSSLVHYKLFSFFSHICSEKFSFFSVDFPFNCPLFIGKHSLFFGVMGTQSLPLCSKTSLFVLSAVQISSLDSPLFQKKKLFHFFLQFLLKKNSWFCKKNLFSSWFTSLFAHSCLFCGRSADLDIGRGSSVAASRLISFLVSSFSCFQCFLLFTLVFFFVFSFCFSFFVPFCNSCFSLPLFCFICLFFPTFFFTPFLQLFLF